MFEPFFFLLFFGGVGVGGVPLRFLGRRWWPLCVRLEFCRGIWGVVEEFGNERRDVTYVEEDERGGCHCETRLRSWYAGEGSAYRYRGVLLAALLGGLFSDCQLAAG